MFGLELGIFALLILCILAACAFEFVNGFHDTANAVATVIYTNSLKPVPAVIWSGICNFIGVFIGGIGVAMGIVKLLPTEALVDPNLFHNVALIMALLLSAIIWNLGTWYLGLPASSSHTLIGSILGVGLAFPFVEENSATAVDFTKAYEIGASLVVSPLIGFSLTVFLMFFLKKFLNQDSIFKEPKKGKTPPLWIRSILVATCTGVSLSHGANDGQKGVGLMMLILIGIMPAFFALNSKLPFETSGPHMTQISQTLARIDTQDLGQKEILLLRDSRGFLAKLSFFSDNKHQDMLSATQKLEIRSSLIRLHKSIGSLLTSQNVGLSKKDRDILTHNLKDLKPHTDYSPFWVTFLISISLGLGTTIGWKRIVKTLGEKIGKEHLTYAQGASSELVAASTIAFSTYLSLPVSTTHVLSSGIAGSMVASKGVKNLRKDTVKNILLAWLLTLPATMLISATLFIIFRAFG
ncbi:MAG TPA: inorganic phosphate transporter [Catalimonadaceae bacterium]|nr:inorganic phosphate transporter [Catalimonadaceae bacterium]